MTNADVTAYIGRWRPSTVSAEAAAFARDMITAVEPEGKERAKNLLWAAGKLADYAIGLGLDPAPEALLRPSVAERFTRCALGLSGVARRTLRTNLRRPAACRAGAGPLPHRQGQRALDRAQRAGRVHVGAGAADRDLELVRGDGRDAAGPGGQPE